jgi:transcription initiation factor IIE alpha subunit
MYGPLHNRETEQFKRSHNKNLRELYGRPKILSYTRNKRLKWLGYVWRVDGRIIKQELMAEMKGKKSLGRQQDGRTQS